MKNKFIWQRIIVKRLYSVKCLIWRPIYWCNWIILYFLNLHCSIINWIINFINCVSIFSQILKSISKLSIFFFLRLKKLCEVSKRRVWLLGRWLIYLWRLELLWILVWNLIMRIVLSHILRLYWLILLPLLLH